MFLEYYVYWVAIGFAAFVLETIIHIYRKNTITLGYILTELLGVFILGPILMLIVLYIIGKENYNVVIWKGDK